MFRRLSWEARTVRKVLRGRPDAFGALVDRYSGMVYGVAYAHVRNTADAEDIVQETFLRLYEWLDRLVTPSSIGPWLVHVARNAATDLHRKRRREAPLDAEAERQAQPTQPRPDRGGLAGAGYGLLVLAVFLRGRARGDAKCPARPVMARTMAYRIKARAIAS